jgi:hypothetical protein
MEDKSPQHEPNPEEKLPSPESTPDTQVEFSFTQRKTNPPQNVTDKIKNHKVEIEAHEIDDLIVLGLNQLNNLRDQLEKKKKSTPGEQKELESQIDDVNNQIAKINSLKRVLIPVGNKGELRVFYSIADSAGGVTEKTCLVDEKTLKEKLENLKDATTIKEVRENKIRMNAILKHPKAGKDTEVQREAIGLKIARTLEFKEVTESTLVYHDTGKGVHPCLFVPFGKMSLMTDFVANQESMHGRLPKEHFDTVEDFGKYSAFFMLCGDPDFMGKTAQNKGLAGDPLKQLYVFDQVFMTDNNFGLDRAFNLVPTNNLAALPKPISRHFMGRNKSVINDSSFAEKIQGAITLLENKEKIQEIFIDISKANGGPDATDPLAKKLQKDAKDCLKTFNTRIASIEKLFPPLTINNQTKKVSDLIKDKDKGNLEILKKSMLATQIINKPKLYDKSGEPYRTPFIANPSMRVKNVSINGDEVLVSFSGRFGRALSENKKQLLTEQGFKISPNGKSATISKENLLKLDERSYFNEQKNKIEPQCNYIEPKKLKQLAKTYNENDEKIQKLISGISKRKDKSIALHETLLEIDKLPFKDKGFAAHAKQCFLYEAMKVIMTKNPDKKAKLESDFALAQKEGRLEAYVRKELKSSAVIELQKFPLKYKEQAAEHRSNFKPVKPQITPSNNDPPTFKN